MPRFRRFKRILKFAVGVLTVFIVLAVIGLVYLARTRVPDLERTVIHPSIKSEVTVVRDDWGVPHIAAANEADAYLALGYCMAQDRLFQMKILSMVVHFFGSWPQTAVSMRNEGCLIDATLLIILRWAKMLFAAACGRGCLNDFRYLASYTFMTSSP